MSTLFSKPKVQRPPPPPTPPTEADASIISAGQNEPSLGFASLAATGATGLKKKAKTVKRSTLG